MIHVYRSSRWLLIAAAIVFIFSGVRIVAAHAKFKSSTPVAGSTVAAPERVIAVYNNHDPLDASVSTLKVVDAAGAQVDAGDAKLDPADTTGKTLIVSLKPGLPDGTYTVNWEAGAADAIETGSFQFTVQAGAAAAPATAPAVPENLPATGIADLASNSLMVGLAFLMLAIGQRLRRRVAEQSM